MKTNLFNTLPRLAVLTVLAVPALALADAEVPHYRVEVIVFSHLDGRPDARRSESIENFSALTDPVRRAVIAALPPIDERPVDVPEDEARVDPDRQTELDATLDLIDALARLEDGELMPVLPTWPEPYLALESLSSRMERALSRLQDSARHEVLAWRAWHQPLSRTTTAERVRVRDDHLIAADWIDLAPSGISASETGSGDQLHGLEPRFHYRLDGGIRLRQRQFMHLEVDLHWRAPQRTSPWMTTLHDDEAGYEIHRLSQSRTVRPDRLEYFDSSWLGMLVLIEELEPLHGSETDEDEARPDPE